MSTTGNEKRPCGTDDLAAPSSAAATRRGFVAALAKLTIVPAVVAGVAANVAPALARE
jgi:hypothetical protein